MWVGGAALIPSLSLTLHLSLSLSRSLALAPPREKEGVGRVIRFRADNTLKSDQWYTRLFQMSSSVSIGSIPLK